MWLCALLLLCPTISFSQTQPKDTSVLTVNTFANGINLRAVTGAPFSANVIRQSKQALGDGTLLTQETHGKIFRDSAGRTRSETELESSGSKAGSRLFVTIVDPMQGTSILLDVAAKDATIFHLPAAPAVSASKLSLATAAQTNRGNVKQLAPPGTEDLGSMMMEGFSVTGTRRTQASKAKASNSSSQSYTETWFSPELKVELQSTMQTGKFTRTARLTQIAPGEPDPNLFQIPADYAVRDNSQSKGVIQ